MYHNRLVGDKKKMSPTRNTISDVEYANSRKVTSEMVEKVKCQNVIYDSEVVKRQNQVKAELSKEKSNRNDSKLQYVKDRMENATKLRALEASLENGASSWLSSLPLKEHGFLLDKQSF